MKHSLSSLRYRLLAGPVDLRPLRVLAAADDDWRGWRARFTILGASHAVCLLRANGSGEPITELLTCAPPAGGAALRERALVAAAGAELEEAAHIGALRAAARIGVFALRDDTGELRGAFAEECRLAHAFPGWASSTPQHWGAGGASTPQHWGAGGASTPQHWGAGGAILPVTRLGWRVDGPRLLVETVHTYPEEGLGVRTETRFTLPEEAAP